MRVRMKPGTCAAGPWGVLTAGSEYDHLPDAVAEGLVAGGYAERVDPAPVAPPPPPVADPVADPLPEVAAAEAAPETATQPRPNRRRRG